ncbi:hypothetical protein F5148DRAFT_1243848 [Russula earlei]|uniref:Uncharacterized protein n=1 Tax=Russula earlei TaxID=71964 RepID=A0ACC0TWU5_9AGAM|nr:hypothetical protein F5148DRAFT_1243848 [Russula earlei]
MSQCCSLLVILSLHMFCKHPHSTRIWSSVPYISYKQPFPSPWRLKKLELVHALYLVPWPVYHKAHWLLQLLLLPSVFWVA